MKLLKEANKAALNEAALYNLDLLEDQAPKIAYLESETKVSSGIPGSIADLKVDWKKATTSKTFNAGHASITSCEGFPGIFAASIILSGNQLKNLKGLPERVYGELWVHENKQLASLEGAPKICERLAISGCDKLTSFEHCPEASDDIDADRCDNIASLKGLPKRMKMFLLNTKQEVSFDCDVLQCFDLTIESANKSLKGFDTAFKGAREISFGRTPIKSHVLGLLRIDGLKSVHTYSKHPDLVAAFEIVNKHLPSTGSMHAILNCQEELIEAGLDEYAKL